MWQVAAGGQDHESQEQGIDDEDGDDGGLHDDDEVGNDQVVEDGNDKHTGSGKKAKATPRKRRPKNVTNGLCDAHFTGPGKFHALTRGALVMWNCSSSAVDVAESAGHAERLSLAKRAVEGFNILGFREQAKTFMLGDYMRSNLANVAKHADQVNVLVLANRYNPCTRQIR